MFSREYLDCIVCGRWLCVRVCMILSFFIISSVFLLLLPVGLTYLCSNTNCNNCLFLEEEIPMFFFFRLTSSSFITTLFFGYLLSRTIIFYIFFLPIATISGQSCCYCYYLRCSLFWFFLPYFFDTLYFKLMIHKLFFRLPRNQWQKECPDRSRTFLLLKAPISNIFLILEKTWPSQV